MPPVRKGSGSGPTGSTRSHHENQERAYIAASRRTDRSMEARLESANRASELHQKRTGKKLRITEDIVANEEMYEEEDPSYEERARRRQQWMSSSNSFSQGTSYSYPSRLQFFPYTSPNQQSIHSPTGSVSTPTTTTNGYLNSPITPTAMHLPQLQNSLNQYRQHSGPNTPIYEEPMQNRPFSNEEINQWEQLNKFTEPMDQTSQDVTFGFSNLLFGGPTTRPSGIKMPDDAFDFGSGSSLNLSDSGPSTSQLSTPQLKSRELQSVAAVPSSTAGSELSDPMQAMFSGVEGDDTSNDDAWFNFSTPAKS